jgi:hypothetical protein
VNGFVTRVGGEFWVKRVAMRDSSDMVVLVVILLLWLLCVQSVLL